MDNKNSKNKKIINFAKTVDIHASWLVVNSVQGCAKACKYCFLKERGLNQTNFFVLKKAEDVVEELLNHKMYNQHIPLCLLPNTDIFASQRHQEEFINILNILISKNVKNTICFITKCFPKNIKSFSEIIDKLKANGNQIISYISYSGLNSDIEIGINHKETMETFKLFYDLKLNIIHYLRLIIPLNFANNKLLEVIDFVKKYAKASVITGLKIYPEMIDQLDFWQELKYKLKNDNAFLNQAINSDCIVPKGFNDFFKNSNFGNYPIFFQMLVLFLMF